MMQSLAMLADEISQIAKRFHQARSAEDNYIAIAQPPDLSTCRSATCGGGQAGAHRVHALNGV